MTTNDHSIKVELENQRATVQFAQDLALAISVGDCITLSGDLGVGKTTLARAIIRSVANDEYLEVPSPTFTLAQTYEMRFTIGHFDLYRIGDPDEVFELGLDDILEQGVALIEWPEMADGALPNGLIEIKLTGLDDVRTLEISGPSTFMDRLKRSLTIRNFVNDEGLVDADRYFLLGDASTRTYERLQLAGSAQMILMNSPRQSDGPIIKDGKTYSEIAHLAEDVVPFVAIADLLKRYGLTSPNILRRSIDDGILIVEDLGAEKPIDDQNVPISERYIASTEMLAFLHSQPLPGELKIDGGYSHSLSHYDEDIMQMEIELLPDWYLPYKTGHPTESGVKNEFISIWRELFLELRKAETSLVLRDFHSPNIIWQPYNEGIKCVGLIDFQDALIGPSAYDLASLAQDARVLVSDELEHKILKTYRSIRLQNDKNFDVKALDEAYAIIAAQRASKVIGIFVRLKERDGKAHYLQHIPRIETYIHRLCHYPVLKPLRDWLEKYQVL